MIIAGQADTTVARLVPALRAALNGRYSRPLFVFLKRQETDRPLFGRRWRNAARAAQTTAIDDRRDADDGASIIEPARFRTCTDLSNEIVTARRAGHDVALLLPPERAAR